MHWPPSKLFVVRTLSLFGCGHFALSLFLWMIMFFAALGFERDRPGSTDWLAFLPALAAVIFTIGFLSAACVARKYPRVALAILVATAALAVGDFAIEVVTESPQVRLFTMEGCKHLYCNWWWYGG